MQDNQKPKTVSMTMRELNESQNALMNLEQQSLDVKTAYWIGKHLKKLRIKYNQILANGEKERRELIEELGEPVMVDDGQGGKKPSGQFSIPDPEKAKLFGSRFDEVLERTVEFEVTQIPLSMLGDTKMQVADMGALDWLIIED